MASEIKRGETLLIPFRNGKNIYDSQCKPRIYKTRKGFERHFPGHYLGKDGVELVEYAEVVRCKDCKFWEEAYGSDGMLGYCINDVNEVGVHTIWYPDDFCSYGERKDNGKID